MQKVACASVRWATARVRHVRGRCLRSSTDHSSVMGNRQPDVTIFASREIYADSLFNSLLK